MRLFILIFIFLILISCHTTFRAVENPTDYTTYIKKGNIEGVIFLENATCYMCLTDKEKFSPTLEEIIRAENILANKLEAFNNPMLNQTQGCPIIHKNLKNYRRQYFGYKNEEGHKIIYAVFNWNRYNIADRIHGYSENENIQWKKEIENMLDGCSYHWTIHINLDKEKLSELNVNGGG